MNNKSQNPIENMSAASTATTTTPNADKEKEDALAGFRVSALMTLAERRSHIFENLNRE
jgi:hypothetical protein